MDTPPRRTAIIVNRQSGTVRTMGEAAVRTLIEEAFRDDGPGVEIALLDGAEIEDAIAKRVSGGKSTG